MTDDLEARFRAAMLACPVVGWRRREAPASAFAALARASADLGLDRWDGYGAGGPVERLETEVAELLGKPAAVFFVSGVMAQQATLRTWCDRRGSTRVAIPDLAHQLHHEQDGPRLLHGFRFEWLTQGREVPTAARVRALPAGLGAVQVELPLREAGCLLPSWEELVGVSEACRELAVPLHVDGARLWESQPFWDRPLAEVAGLADSVYVSFYKGLGGLAGAAVATEPDVADELRQWRTRMGGTLYRMTPYAVSALVGLRDRLPEVPSYVERARDLAAALVERGLRVAPDPPHTNTFQVSAEVEPDLVTERLIGLMAREGVLPCFGWSASADVPGHAVAEVAVHEEALRHDPAVVAGWFAELVAPR
ncbi:MULTISPECIES: threonine aldolase family protein [unclassified Nocardioides]|uniref:threonine aldolase family protein n=1 Tax=unclassified Nocardioides TaxID=2615069 RepID=UPI00301556D5